MSLCEHEHYYRKKSTDYRNSVQASDRLQNSGDMCRVLRRHVNVGMRPFLQLKAGMVTPHGSGDYCEDTPRCSLEGRQTVRNVNESLINPQLSLQISTTFYFSAVCRGPSPATLRRVLKQQWPGSFHWPFPPVGGLAPGTGTVGSRTKAKALAFSMFSKQHNQKQGSLSRRKKPNGSALT